MFESAARSPCCLCPCKALGVGPLGYLYWALRVRAPAVLEEAVEYEAARYQSV